MEETATGLKERIAEEHRRLAPFFEQLREALGGRGAIAVRDAFEQLQDELERHLAQEDRLYYPTLSALRPGHRETLRRFVLDHDSFRAELEAIDGWLEAEETARARARFETLARSFAAHEVHEEEVLHRINAEAENSTPRLG